ncbi:unnamed protein product [Rotaria magnacalcarata]|uniref:Uncharacterized protein n=1 Tax=Rotaria magnacalcarata TaxID=392030 RepID=A0A819IQ17_9BILA|nr:unnamed protein product [Rotaria magnacalcarata]CAF3918035.1 unnamed protein product [Rotaria magnacalcarata]
MTSDPSLTYPSDYYYPEFIESRPDDPLKSPSSRLQITTAIDKGIGSTVKPLKNTDRNTETVTKTTSANRNQSLTNVPFDVVTDHGLPDTGIIQALKTDPKKNLLRDPAARNIPRLIVDDSVIKQNIRGPKIITTNPDDNLDQTKKINKNNNGKQTPASRQPNGDFNNRFIPPEPVQQYPISYVDNQQAIDDYWKKEVRVDNEGLVTIEPIKYDRESYEGPFGLTRQGAVIYYFGMGIFTLLAGIFLIMTGIFYAQNYPSGSSKTGILTGLCICGFAFYIGLQLILIGIWHQKHRYENPKKPHADIDERNDSKTRLKSAMEVNEQYNYPYQQPVDYPPYEYYPNPPYASNVSEQMLLQQPGAATGAAYYDPVVWPSNVEIDARSDARYFQPTDSLYGQDGTSRTPKTPAPTAVPLKVTNSMKKSQHDYSKTPVEVKQPKAKFDNLFPNSTATEESIPHLTKAPETNDLIRTIMAHETTAGKRSPHRSSRRKPSNQIKPFDQVADSSIVSSSKHQSSDSRHHQRRRRRHSYSSCSTCSNNSYDRYPSDVNFKPRQYQKQNSSSLSLNFTPQTSETSTNNRQKTNKQSSRDTGYGARKTDNIYTTNGLEDIPNARDNRVEKNPVIRRTVIMEPYSTQSNSTAVVNPRIEKTKQKTTEKNNTRMATIHLEDVYEDMNENENLKSKRVKHPQ